MPRHYTAALCALTLYSLPLAALELELPIDPLDAASNFLGVAGFGYHVSEHRLDGHPGLDFEYRVGAKVKAAIGGKLNYFTDVYDSSKITVQVDFSADGKSWRNVYTNISALEPGLDKGSTLTQGQAIGTAGVVTFKSGSTTISYAMTHFQLDDMSGAVNYGLSNTSAVSPVPYFSTRARASFNELASKVTYHQQLCEPMMTTPRGLQEYPTLARTWTLSVGSHASRIDLTCNHSGSASAYGYSLFDSNGTMLEYGTASVDPALSALPKLDMTSSAGGRRLAVYAVNGVDRTLRLDYSDVGGNRPTSFNNASSFTSELGAVACAAATDVLCLEGEASPYRGGDTLNIRIALRLSQLAASVTPEKLDLWVAEVVPYGTLWFVTASGLTRSAAPHTNEVGRSERTVGLFANIPATMALNGSFTVYALLAPSGTPPDKLVDSRQGNLLAVTTVIAVP